MWMLTVIGSVLSGLFCWRDSSGFWNHRHQADVCHAYQILRRGGLKEENIVVFMTSRTMKKILTLVLLLTIPRVVMSMQVSLRTTQARMLL